MIKNQIVSEYSLIADIKNIYNNLISRGYDEISVWQKDIDALQKLNDMMLDALNSSEIVCH